MIQIITASGKKFDSDYFIPLENPSVLIFRILNASEDQIRSVFSNPMETSCLKCGSRTAFGYTHLDTIFKEGDAFKVVLSR